MVMGLEADPKSQQCILELESPGIVHASMHYATALLIQERVYPTDISLALPSESIATVYTT